MKAMELLEKGYGLTETCRVLGWPETKASLLYHWKHGRIPPLAKWVAEPSEELAYAIGAISDGCIIKNEAKYDYIIKFKVIDKDFAVTINTVMSKLLNKKYIEPRWDKSDKQWVVEYYSKAFVMWYKKQNLNELKKYIEHDKSTVRAFLRGLYDAEGHNNRCKQIILSNSDLKLLKYVQYLLEKYFGITATGPYLNKRAGKVSIKKNGEKIKTKHYSYVIAISKKEHLHRFLNEVGFTIRRKQLGLKKKELVKQGFFRPPFSDIQ